MLYIFAAMELFLGEIDTLDTSEQREAINRFNHFRNRVNEGLGMMPSMAMIRNVAV